MSWRDRPYARQNELYTPGSGAFYNLSITHWLLIINSGVFLLDTVLSSSARAAAFSPARWGAFTIERAITHLELWRLITYQFIHSGLLHILFNMIGLYFFGPIMERWWGSRRFLAFYLLCGVSGAVVYTLLSWIPGLLSFTSPQTVLVGASGSLFGILVGCALVAPDMQVMLLFPPVPMTMRTMALVFLGIAVLSVLVGSANAGGEAAHLGGAALGFLLTRHPELLDWASRGGPLTRWRQRWRRWQQERQRRRLEAEEAEVDRILAKVRAHGLQSLTEREKRTLRRATERYRRTG